MKCDSQFATVMMESCNIW